MRIEYAAYIGTACLIWSRVSWWYNRIAKISTPFIQAAEEMSKDGKVDKVDRKKLVMMAISAIEEEGKIRIPFFVRPFIGMVVDRIAGKLPDFTISETAVDIMEKQKNVLVK